MTKNSLLKNFLKVILALLILAGSAYGLQYYFHIFNATLKRCNHYIATANTFVYKDLFWGISTGTVLFIAILIILPVMMRNIHTRSYFKNLFQGIISTGIFYISQSLYDYLEKISKFYLIITLIGIASITLILIRIVTLLYKKEKEKVAFRTNYVASITAGLIFGVLLQLVNLWTNWAKANFHFKLH